MQTWNQYLPQNKPRTEAEMRDHLLNNRSVTASGCWEWKGSLSRSGYGKIKWRTFGDLRVDRVAALLWLGMRLDDSHLVCHSCDNPPCFNPAHLFIGTAKDNQVDSVKKRRHVSVAKTHCKRGHPFDSQNTCICAGARVCRECHRNQASASYRRRVSQ